MFVDEAGTTKRTRCVDGRDGRAHRAHIPLPPRRQTFVVALRCDHLTPQWIIDHSMNCQNFRIRVEFAPTLQSGDVVIRGIGLTKSAKAKAIFKEGGAWFLILPTHQNSP